MLLMNSYIIVTSISTERQLVFDFVNRVEIESTFKRLTDTATITLPRKLSLQNENLKQLIKRGDLVTIQLGYDGNLNTEFTGFVRDVEVNEQAVIHCEDSMYLLKKKKSIDQDKPNAWRAIDLEGLISRLVGDTVQWQVSHNFDIGAYRLTEDTVAKELDKLRERAGIFAYFRGTKLIVGFAYELDKASNKVAYKFQWNVLENSLEYKDKEQTKIKIKAVNVKPDGSQTTQDFGDEDGELRTLHYYNKADSGIKSLVEADLEKLKFTGYQGDILVLGEPYCSHGWIADLKDDVYPEKEGSYLIDKVVVSYDINGGYRRKITLGGKV